MEVVVVSLMNRQGNDKLLAVCSNMDKAKEKVMDIIKEEKEKYDYPEPKVRMVPCHMYGIYVEAKFDHPQLGKFSLEYGLDRVKVI